MLFNMTNKVWNVHHTLVKFTITSHLDILIRHWSGMMREVCNVHHNLVIYYGTSHLVVMQERHTSMVWKVITP